MVVGSKVDFEKFKNAIFYFGLKKFEPTLGVDFNHPVYLKKNYTVGKNKKKITRVLYKNSQS